MCFMHLTQMHTIKHYAMRPEKCIQNLGEKAIFSPKKKANEKIRNEKRHEHHIKYEPHSYSYSHTAMLRHMEPLYKHTELQLNLNVCRTAISSQLNFA